LKDLNDYLSEGTFRVRPETFAVVKARSPREGAFALISDGAEITLVLDQSNLGSADYSNVDLDWKCITFEIELPFELAGFMAAVAGALAEKGVALFALSAFSTDHILVKKDRLTDAVDGLEGLGFSNISSF
jgi:hypothetical protein